MTSPNTTVADPGGYEQASALLAQNWWAFAMRGLLGIIFGLIAIFLPGVTMLSLVLVFSAYALVDGIFAIMAAVRAMRQHERWGFLLLEGVVNIIAAGIRSRPMVVGAWWPCIGNLWRVADRRSFPWCSGVDLVARCLCDFFWCRAHRSGHQAARATA